MATRPRSGQQDATQERALALAYRYLNQQERCEAELRRRLTQAEFGNQEIDATIETLLEQGLLDDARFVRLFADDKRRLEQWGEARIRGALLKRGIDRELIDEVLDPGASAELERALALLRARFPSPPRERRERDRALGVLLRKGYDPELALEALASYARGATASLPSDARDQELG